MKRLFVILTAAAVIMSTASCSKEGVKRFGGNYSFKTSGTVTAVSVPADATVAADTVMVDLTPESGQLSIVTSDKSAGDMIVAMNILGGKVLTFNANADGKTLTLEPFQRTLTLHVGSILTELIATEAEVTVSGYGERYDDSLLLYLTYEGGYTHLGTQYEIVSSDVSCWAKSND